MINANKARHPDMCGVQGIEEEFSDMHLATAGTRAGLVALQLHCSVPGIPLAALEAAIRRALPARLKLLDSIEAAGKPVRPPVQRGALYAAQ